VYDGFEGWVRVKEVRYTIWNGVHWTHKSYNSLPLYFFSEAHFPLCGAVHLLPEAHLPFYEAVHLLSEVHLPFYEAVHLLSEAHLDAEAHDDVLSEVHFEIQFLPSPIRHLSC
jgi:hypothetical protein